MGGINLFQPELSPSIGGVVELGPPPIGGGGIPSSSFANGNFDCFFIFIPSQIRKL